MASASSSGLKRPGCGRHSPESAGSPASSAGIGCGLLCIRYQSTEGSAVSNRVLSGKVAIVTGGSKGIGKAIASALAGAGASVALAARGEEDLARAAKEVEASGGEAGAVPTDVTDPSHVTARSDRTGDRSAPAGSL